MRTNSTRWLPPNLLVMPSYFESLSMVALEAWALGKPVLANGKCDVLKGQCIRSNGGLYYEGVDEFVATLSSLERNRWLSASLGRNGRQFYHEHYDWPVIERKYLDMLDRLSKEGSPRAVDPLPGWMERRRQDCAPGAEVVAALPSGPVPFTERSPVVPRPQTTPPPAVNQGNDRDSGRHHHHRPPHRPRHGGPARTGGR